MSIYIPKMKAPYVPIPPSKRKRPKWVPAPEGLIDAWRVSMHRSGVQWTLLGFYSNEDAAYAKADQEWERVPMDCTSGVRVEHKAALEIKGRLHMVNILPFKFLDEPLVDLEKPAPEERFLKDFVNNEVSTQELFENFRAKMKAHNDKV